MQPPKHPAHQHQPRQQQRLAKEIERVPQRLILVASAPDPALELLRWDNDRRQIFREQHHDHDKENQQEL